MNQSTSSNATASQAAPPSYRPSVFRTIFTYIPGLIQLLLKKPDVVSPIKIKEPMKVETPRICNFRRMDLTLDKVKVRHPPNTLFF